MRHEPLTNAKAVFSELVLALCQKPDKCHVDYSSMPNIRIIAHPNDAKIIVGRGGRHLNALAVLARLMFSPGVNIMPVESLPGKVVKDKRFKPRDNWDGVKAREMAVRLARNCFVVDAVTVKTEAFSPTSQKMSVVLSPTPPPLQLNQFSEAIAVVFVPIGANYGRLIYANAV